MDSSAPPEPTYDCIVLGAGISGLVSASVLLQQGAERILVVDEYDHVGGNHIDRSVGGFTFDIGSLIFQDDSPLLVHFPELLERYVEIDPTWARINPQRMVTTYPFSVRDDVLAAGPLECLRMLGSAVIARLRRRRLQNACDFAEHWLGPRFVRHSGLGTYMERFCGLPTDRIDLEFAQSRMMWIADHARLTSLARRVLGSVRRAPQAPRSNIQLARPREGFAHLYAPAVERLEARGVTFSLGTSIDDLRRIDGCFQLRTAAGVATAPRVVSTVPIDRAIDLCGLRGDEAPLPTVLLMSLFFSFSGRRGFSESVLYNFSHEGVWKRLTMYSDFYGRHNDREYFGVEVIAGAGEPSFEAAEADFREHTRANGLLGGDLRLEGSYLLSNAYPIYTRGSGQHARRAIGALRAFGVESLGRQGGFQYQPTARASTIEAEAALRGGPPTPTASASSRPREGVAS